MNLLFAISLLAQSANLPAGDANATPACPKGSAECDPWEHYRKRPTNPFDQFDKKPEPEKLGPGPHTLVISDKDGMTQINYPNGERCLRARNEIRRQTGTVRGQQGGTEINVIAAYPKTFCVPR